MAVLEDLLALQLIDTEISQIEHRAAHLPEAAALSNLQQRDAELEREYAQARAALAALETTLESNETRVVDLRREIDKLNAQLRTVIAPREAEALQHEIALRDESISLLDDQSLSLLDDASKLEGEITRLHEARERSNAEVRAGRGALEIAQEETRSMLGDTRARRAAIAVTVDDGWLAHYEQKRRDLAGIAVARLVRGTCGGCHLDLSPTETDAVKREAPDKRECPNCTRWLVV